MCLCLCLLKAAEPEVSQHDHSDVRPKGDSPVPFECRCARALCFTCRRTRAQSARKRRQSRCLGVVVCTIALFDASVRAGWHSRFHPKRVLRVSMLFTSKIMSSFPFVASGWVRACSKVQDWRVEKVHSVYYIPCESQRVTAATPGQVGKLCMIPTSSAGIQCMESADCSCPRSASCCTQISRLLYAD